MPTPGSARSSKGWPCVSRLSSMGNVGSHGFALFDTWTGIGCLYVSDAVYSGHSWKQRNKVRQQALCGPFCVPACCAPGSATCAMAGRRISRPSAEVLSHRPETTERMASWDAQNRGGQLRTGEEKECVEEEQQEACPSLQEVRA